MVGTVTLIEKQRQVLTEQCRQRRAASLGIICVSPCTHCVSSTRQRSFLQRVIAQSLLSLQSLLQLTEAVTPLTGLAGGWHLKKQPRKISLICWLGAEQNPSRSREAKRVSFVSQELGRQASSI